MARRHSTNVQVAYRIHDLTQNISHYLRVFADSNKWVDSLQSHLDTIGMRNELGIGGSIESNEFLGSLRDTLVGWKVDVRAASLVSSDKFIRQFRINRSLVESLDSGDIAGIDDATADRLWQTIQSLGLSETGTQIVTGTKALHHLVPALLPPIDRRYTGTFFRYGRSAPQFSSNNKRKQKEAFQYILGGLSLIAQQVDLSQHVDPTLTTYATGETKVIDNAIVGYVLDHRL